MESRGADAPVIGNVTPRDGQYSRFRLMTCSRARSSRFLYRVSAGQLRLTAHKIADVYEKLTATCVRDQIFTS